MEHEESPTMNIKELAPYIGCSIPECRKMIHKKKIPYRKIGNRYIFDTPIIKLWLQQAYAKEGFKYEV